MRLLMTVTSWLLNMGFSWLGVRRFNPRRAVKGPCRNGNKRHDVQRTGERSPDMADDDSERGKPATFDRRTGEVHGSGSGAGGGGSPAEDYDQDPMAGSGA